MIFIFHIVILGLINEVTVCCLPPSHILPPIRSMFELASNPGVEFLSPVPCIHLRTFPHFLLDYATVTHLYSYPVSPKSSRHTYQRWALPKSYFISSHACTEFPSNSSTPGKWTHALLGQHSENINHVLRPAQPLFCYFLHKMTWPCYSSLSLSLPSSC